MKGELELTIDMDANVGTYTVYGWIDEKLVGQETSEIPCGEYRHKLCTGEIVLTFLREVIPVELFQAIDNALAADPVLRYQQHCLDNDIPLPEYITEEMVLPFKDQ